MECVKSTYDVFLTQDYNNWEFGRLITDRNKLESLEYAMAVAKYLKEEYTYADHVYIVEHKTFEVAKEA